jgi:hypothetical protein
MTWTCNVSNKTTKLQDENRYAELTGTHGVLAACTLDTSKMSENLRNQRKLSGFLPAPVLDDVLSRKPLNLFDLLAFDPPLLHKCGSLPIRNLGFRI